MDIIEETLKQHLVESLTISQFQKYPPQFESLLKPIFAVARRRDENARDGTQWPQMAYTLALKCGYASGLYGMFFPFVEKPPSKHSSDENAATFAGVESLPIPTSIGTTSGDSTEAEFHPKTIKITGKPARV